MEAQSLASLNRLAANPPAYPTNPAEDLQEPLTLYISRVPGTRDVILSPFKPQLKNVTGEDVASCLYYVHLDMASPPSHAPGSSRDEDMRKSIDDAASIKTIHRKPLPGSALSSAPAPAPAPAPTPTPGRPPLPNTPPQPQRRPVLPPRDNQTSRPGRQRGISLGSADWTPNLAAGKRNDSGLGLSNGYSDSSHLATPSRKISMRKPVASSVLATSSLHSRDSSPSSELRRLQLDPSPMPEDVRGANAMYEAPQIAPLGHRYTRSLSPTKQEAMPAPFTLTLIRRDPSTSNQWNVGKISSYQVDNASTQSPWHDQLLADPSTFPEPTFMQHPPINVSIETSGYARFRNSRPKESFDFGSATAGQIRASIDSGGFSRKDAAMYFSRQVSMAYSKSWTSNLKEKFQQASRKKNHGRSESLATPAMANPTDPSMVSPEAPTQERLKARGYTFQSPWDKRCEFRTGNGGRSLQCRHILNDNPIVAYNPLVPDSTRPSTVVVSDLRFNLPGAEFFPPSEAQKDTTKENKLGHFGKFLMSATGMDEYYDSHDSLVSPFDVNIGGEKAGGGSHGTRAKLGKLIIYHDGLKMLDLLVAANMGVWWGTWEKSF